MWSLARLHYLMNLCNSRTSICRVYALYWAGVRLVNGRAVTITLRCRVGPTYGYTSHPLLHRAYLPFWSYVHVMHALLKYFPTEWQWWLPCTANFFTIGLPHCSTLELHIRMHMLDRPNYKGLHTYLYVGLSTNFNYVAGDSFILFTKCSQNKVCKIAYLLTVSCEEWKFHLFQ